MVDSVVEVTKILEVLRRQGPERSMHAHANHIREKETLLKFFPKNKPRILAIAMCFFDKLWYPEKVTAYFHDDEDITIIRCSEESIFKDHPTVLVYGRVMKALDARGNPVSFSFETPWPILHRRANSIRKLLELLQDCAKNPKPSPIISQADASEFLEYFEEILSAILNLKPDDTNKRRSLLLTLLLKAHKEHEEYLKQNPQPPSEPPPVDLGSLLIQFSIASNQSRLFAKQKIDATPVEPTITHYQLLRGIAFDMKQLTSGKTGQSNPILKIWHEMVSNSDSSESFYRRIKGTIPPVLEKFHNENNHYGSFFSQIENGKCTGITTLNPEEREKLLECLSSMAARQSESESDNIYLKLVAKRVSNFLATFGPIIEETKYWRLEQFDQKIAEFSVPNTLGFKV